MAKIIMIIIIIILNKIFSKMNLNEGGSFTFRMRVTAGSGAVCLFHVNNSFSIILFENNISSFFLRVWFWFETGGNGCVGNNSPRMTSQFKSLLIAFNKIVIFGNIGFHRLN